MSKAKLLDKVHNIIRLKHFSIRMEEAHLHLIKRFSLFHNKIHRLEITHSSNTGDGKIGGLLFLEELFCISTSLVNIHGAIVDTGITPDSALQYPL